MSRFLLLTDFAVKPDWEFLTGFRKVCTESPEVHSCTSNYLRKGLFDRFRRYLLYFTFPLSQLKYNGRYESIIGYQQFYALNLAFFMRLFGVKKRSRLYVVAFIYKDKKGLIGKLYRKYIKRIISSGYIDRFFVFSTSEPAYYASLFDCPKDLFIPCRLGIDTLNDITGCKGDYFFATGRSNRDYDFLMSEFVGSKRKLLIATDEPLRPASDNISVLSDCSGMEMVRTMAGAFCVLIPLKNPDISAGQLVALQALQLGKPVIATRCPGLSDYLEDGITALLMDNTHESLADCIERLSDPLVYEQLSQKAKESFHNYFSLEGQGAFICENCLGKE